MGEKGHHWGWSHLVIARLFAFNAKDDEQGRDGAKSLPRPHSSPALPRGSGQRARIR